MTRLRYISRQSNADDTWPELGNNKTKYATNGKYYKEIGRNYYTNFCVKNIQVVFICVMCMKERVMM